MDVNKNFAVTSLWQLQASARWGSSIKGETAPCEAGPWLNKPDVRVGWRHHIFVFLGLCQMIANLELNPNKRTTFSL
jgi:hypothetical protein